MPKNSNDKEKEDKQQERLLESFLRYTQAQQRMNNPADVFLSFHLNISLSKCKLKSKSNNNNKGGCKAVSL